MTVEPRTPDLEELIRRGIEAVNRREYDRAVTHFAPDAVWDGATVGGNVWEGREAIRDFLGDWIGAYEDFWQEVEEFRDFGNGVTFGVFHQRGQPRGSSEVVTFRVAIVAIWAESLIERMRSYRDFDQARAAAERLAQERG
jgi:ketosteroid isomerase-like protein